MITSITHLRAGIQWWNSNGRWGLEFLNSEYYDIYEDRKGGPTEEWLNAAVERLGRWRAYRSPKPPNTKAEILRRGRQVLEQIEKLYERLVKQSRGEPSIVDCQWEDVDGLFCLAWRVKPSAVFVGKMCHFLFPKLFIVMDNLATSVFDYEFYWRGMKDEWNRLKEKNEARTLLSEAIVSDKPLHPLYPLETKIMELSHIGYKHG